jgi:hypothetical protein
MNSQNFADTYIHFRFRNHCKDTSFRSCRYRIRKGRLNIVGRRRSNLWPESRQGSRQLLLLLFES